MKSRTLDVFAMLLVGDGILSLLQTRRHCLLWQVGPEFCRELVDEFVEHPSAARTAGFAELILGVWLARREESRPFAIW
jgi:hypothetical protein